MVADGRSWRPRLPILILAGVLFTLFGVVSSQRDLLQTLESKRGMCLVHPRNCRGGFKKRTSKTSLKSSLSDKEEVVSKEWLWILQTVRSANIEDRTDSEISEFEDKDPLLESIRRRLAHNGPVSRRTESVTY